MKSRFVFPYLVPSLVPCLFSGLISCLMPILMLSFMSVAPTPAAAHDKSQSFSKWRHSGDAMSVVFTVAARQVTLLPPANPQKPDLQQTLQRHLSRNISVIGKNATCRLSAFQPVPARSGFLAMRARLDCPPETKQARLRITTFFEAASTHVHFAQLRNKSGSFSEFLFTYDNTETRIELDERGTVTAQPDGVFMTLVNYARLGFLHILDGYDHMAFLLGLLLLVRRLPNLIFVITGFTLGHSLTLALATLGYVNVQSSLIEALIGFTIIIVAAESVLLRRQQLWLGGSVLAGVLMLLSLLSMFLGGPMPLTGWAGLMLFAVAYGLYLTDENTARRNLPFLTLLFGLIHGFGFAGAISDIGLPTGRLVTALLGFNIGVEIGQILIVTLLWFGVFSQIQKRLSSGFAYKVNDSIAIGLTGVGFYWFVGRLLVPF